MVLSTMQILVTENCENVINQTGIFIDPKLHTKVMFYGIKRT